MSVQGVNIPFLVDTVVNNVDNSVTNNSSFYVSGGGIIQAGISGVGLFSGSMGMTGLGGITVSLVSGNNGYGFSGLFQISGRNPVGTYYFVFPSTVDTTSNNLIPNLYSNELNTAYEFAATLKIPCSGQPIIGNVNKNGSNLFAFTVPTGVTQTTSGINFSIASGDVLSASLSQVGTTHAGTTLTVSINVK